MVRVLSFAGRLTDRLRKEPEGVIRARLPRTTILAITHRLATALSADHVVCPSDRRIMEEGCRRA